MVNNDELDDHAKHIILGSAVTATVSCQVQHADSTVQQQEGGWGRGQSGNLDGNCAYNFQRVMCMCWGCQYY